MNPERWKRIDALLSAALEHEEKERASFLVRACEGDEELRNEVHGLLAAHQAASTFPEAPPTDAAATIAAQPEMSANDARDPGPPVGRLLERTLPSHAPGVALKRGFSLGRYVVLNKLGGGGMGVVYAAYDPELDRKVALKLLQAEATGELKAGGARARLLREAQAMARLSHPNVISVHDVGTLGKQVFIAMELVDGRTLTRWLREKERRSQDILEVFVPAGRGLAAAHAAGLVHRDFKPDNVLIGNDGQVKVLDFGLARAAEDLAGDSPTLPPQLEAHGPSARPLETPLTRTGAFMGTPAYMSPEQLLGKKTDARTDQFSFCVALYEALYGERPFEGNSVDLLTQQVTEGNVKEPPKSSRVPDSVRQIVLRGLRRNPDERFSSMEELLHQLRRDPRAFRRRVLAGGSALVLLAAVGVGYRQWVFRHSQVCQGAEKKLAGVWDGEQKRAVSAGLLATGRPYAKDTVFGVEKALDAYAHSWVQMQTDACEATRIRGEQSEELLDLRMSCLSRRREELKALARIFATADSKVVEKAVTAARGLSDIEGCGDAEALKTPLKPPPDMTVRVKVEEVRLKLSHVKALIEAGRYAEALPLARQAAKDGESLRYRPLEAETFFLIGQTLDIMGEYRQSEETLLSAAFAAESARHDEIAARGWGLLISISASLSKFDAAEHWAKLSFAAIERMGGNDRLLLIPLNNLGIAYGHRFRNDEALDCFRRALAAAERVNATPSAASALNNIGSVLLRQGKADEALVQFEHALALNEQLVGPMHPSIAANIGNIGSALKKQKNYDQALAYYHRSAEIMERNFGSDYPNLAVNFANIGSVLALKGNYDEGLRWLERARLLMEKTLGPDHPQIAEILGQTAETHLRSGEPEKAIPLLERTLEIHQSKQVASYGLMGGAQFALARALSEVKREPKRARALAEQARDSFKKEGGRYEGELSKVEDWLAKKSFQ